MYICINFKKTFGLVKLQWGVNGNINCEIIFKVKTLCQLLDYLHVSENQ